MMKDNQTLERVMMQRTQDQGEEMPVSIAALYKGRAEHRQRERDQAVPAALFRPSSRQNTRPPSAALESARSIAMGGYGVGDGYLYSDSDQDRPMSRPVSRQDRRKGGSPLHVTPSLWGDTGSDAERDKEREREFLGGDYSPSSPMGTSPLMRSVSLSRTGRPLSRTGPILNLASVE
ncbi:hypothetical protein KIPB_014925, partial [Kipferlia bialata]|eukprot:g14925.t1